ncbi:MAG TPA: hypothetical protein VF644_12275 [Pyrinomonadaceae bacterium]|jgi:hypothetical protein
MRVPNAEKAVVDIRKLRDYCLNPNHEVGKHKARIFAAAFGLTSADASELQTALHEAIKNIDAEIGRLDEYGQRYTIDFNFEWKGKHGIIRSGWIIKTDSEAPTLVTCLPI